MEFKVFKKMMQDNFAEMSKDATHLFEVEVDRDEMWNHYLDSFLPKYNKMFRERREHDCSCCRQFIKSIGNAVVIKDNVIHTIWDFVTGTEEYQIPIDAMSAYIKAKAVTNVYISKEKNIGTNMNHEQMEDKTVKEWNHFYLQLPRKFVSMSSDTEGTIQNGFRTLRDVFKRGLDELTEESVLTVLELIASNTLYRGEEAKVALTEFLRLKKEYAKLVTEEEKANFAWEQSVSANRGACGIRNTAMGTLLINISGRTTEDGEVIPEMDLDLAVDKYEAIMAPENYKRPKAIFTKKMLENAKKTLEELGYMDSLGRRHANLDDITVNNILFINRDTAKKVGKLDVFEEMSGQIAVNPKSFSKVEEISIKDFLENVLPVTQELEVFLENRLTNRMVSLVAPEDSDAKSMLKWDTNFGWAYAGNMADSSMKERVKSAGGKVDGDLRFSIQWNEEGQDVTDLDAHCVEPIGGGHIYFGERFSRKTGGTLDVDIQRPRGTAVENITWATRNNMIDGVYKLYVDDYSGRGAKRGFRAEVEFDGIMHSFDCPPFTSGTSQVQVAEVTLKNGEFTIKEILPSTTSSRDIWGLDSNQFVPVSVAMFSPNHWNGQEGISLGHKHVFFMLKGCKNPEQPNGFFNEYLKQDLMEHKRVFEALGSKMRVADSEQQLSGVGFSTTTRSEVIVRVTGQTKRVMKIKF